MPRTKPSGTTSSRGFFGVLQDDDDDNEGDDKEEDHQDKQHVTTPRKSSSNYVQPPSSSSTVHIPSFEDLSSVRMDEITVLEAVYGEDFTNAKGVWGCPLLQVKVRPPDVEPNRIGTHLTLSVQLTKQYPYVVPMVELKNVKGLSHDETLELHRLLNDRAKELSESGSVMMIELVQATEDFLLAHNFDPTMSAWEQMKAREAAQLEQAKAVEEEMARLMNSGSSGPATQTSNLKSGTGKNISQSNSKVTFRDDSEVRTIVSDAEHCPPRDDHKVAIERELQRQQEAFAAVRKLRADGGTTQPIIQGGGGNADMENYEDDDEDEDDDADEDMEENAAMTQSGASRYKSDFIELGVLGRGGGGEVVKVRNRLDRRIYAIKKIILESEEGRFAQYGAIQNRKLRREVTTISRMTHKNIVRYYQAWVEGGTTKASSNEPSSDERKVKDGAEQSSSSSRESDDNDDDSEEPDGGWWTNSPMEHELPAQMHHKGSKVSLGVSSFDDFGDDDSESSEPLGSTSRLRSLHSDSTVNLLEHENDHGFHSPLLHGLGLQSNVFDSIYETTLPKPTDTSTEEDLEAWDESSVKVGSTSGRAILYIQMEYCATTLRKLIDDREFAKMQENQIWRLVRQTLEALIYLHRSGLIHRDLKPSNVFATKAPFGEIEIKLGDFGLATMHRGKVDAEEPDMDKALDTLHEFYGVGDDESRGYHGDTVFSSERMSIHSTTGESMTGGVGTTFYIAPEQEGAKGGKRNGESLMYTMKADIFSFGVILFEIFHPPFETYMERAEILTTLRGDRDPCSASQSPEKGWKDSDKEEFHRFARNRFPPSFVEAVPENAQRMILWCLERNPTKRPTAEELLASELLPRKIELEQHYLDEALEILVASSQSDSYLQIVDAIFSRPNSDLVEFTFDTDVASKSNFMLSGDSAMELIRAIGSIRAGSIDMATLTSLAMSSSSIVASTSSLKRSRNAGRLGKGGKGMLKRSTQRAAGILAMRAAAAAAVTGTFDGVHGADPLVVERILELCKGVFQMHGAVRLRSPLLRPRTTAATKTIGGPAEMINSRGVVLLLPEDLTAPFARALGRGGSAASNLKRYDIGRIFHKSMAEGHPREALEASFDVVQEDSSLGYLTEAETIIVTSQIMALLPRRTISSAALEVTSPMWYLRVNHTRLADSLLDICGVPPKEAARRFCFQILSRFTAPPPYLLRTLFSSKKKPANRRSSSDAESMPDLSLMLETAVTDHGLSRSSAEKLQLFVKNCMPLPVEIDDAIESLRKGITALRGHEKLDDTRRLKRFEDAARSLRSLRDLFLTLQTLQFAPVIARTSDSVSSSSFSLPLYVSFDLGLRQHRKHYHGGLIFQCIALPDTYFEDLDPTEHNDALILPSGRGSKVAEGGNFSELVRKHRPPGNFGSAFINYYTSAPIPVCAGVRISIGKLIELAYLDAASNVQRISTDGWNELMHKSSIDKPGLEVLRQSLGHPLQFAESIQCLVSSVHGMDTASTRERFSVASRLWQAGISAEYLPQSGVMLSLLKRLRDDSGEGSSDWSLSELVGVCALLNIPYLVIVQPHLLRDKGSVRLRRFPYDVITQGYTSSSTNEVFVSLDDLPSAILGDGPEEDIEAPAETSLIATTSSARDVNRSSREIQCIYVDHDQYFGNDREVSKSETPQWKSYLKSMKSISLSAQSYLTSLMGPQSPTGGAPVFAVADASYFVLRDFGTALMKRETTERSATGAANETIERHSKHKRVIKTLSVAIDNFMRRQGYWSTSSGTTSSGSHHKSQLQQQQQQIPGGSSLVTLLLYSKVDDRFDLVTLSGATRSNGSIFTKRGK